MKRRIAAMTLAMMMVLGASGCSSNTAKETQSGRESHRNSG